MLPLSDEQRKKRKREKIDLVFPDYVYEIRIGVNKIHTREIQTFSSRADYCWDTRTTRNVCMLCSVDITLHKTPL